MGPIPIWVTDLQKARREKLLGREILYLESTPSTNRRAREEALRGAPEGMAVIADFQSQGKRADGPVVEFPGGGQPVSFDRVAPPASAGAGPPNDPAGGRFLRPGDQAGYGS